jgi:DNA-binding PadR family transcriptional regulator
VVNIRDNIKGGALTETTFLILLALYKPNHGYGIMQFIEEATNGRVVLGAGTLYGAINTLLMKKWIAPFGEETESRKKEYLITDIGKQMARKEINRMAEVLRLASTIIGGEKSK